MRAGKLKSSLFGLIIAFALPSAVNAAGVEKDYSAAERMIFMSGHLGNISPPQILRYTFRRSGSLEGSFEDGVAIDLTADRNGACCTANASFLSGVHQLVLPEVETATANPVILYFLEHDVRDMQRRTSGQANHFRKRIRMAIYNAASVQEATFRYQGKAVAGHQLVLSPYDDDPNRPRFEQFANKQYVFMLSDAVPGGVFGIRTQMHGASATPLVVEELYLDGATAPIPFRSHVEHGGEQ